MTSATENLIQVDRHIDFKTHAVHSYDELGEFLEQDSPKSGINTIWHGGLPVDFRLSLQDSHTLIVVLNGATTSGVRLPWLSGTGITRGMDASKLFISDPSLYLGQRLTSAYYSGSKHQPDLQDDLVQIIRKVKEAAGAEHIVFLGGSSGGFAALRLSASFPESTAVVFNPQTNLWFHLPRPVIKWLKVCWGTRALRDLPETVIYDLTVLYSGKFENRVVYLQNRTDHHYDRHFLPFLKKVGMGNVQYLVHDEAEGHNPPPKELIRRVLEQACETGIEDVLEGFTSRPTLMG